MVEVLGDGFGPRPAMTPTIKLRTIAPDDMHAVIIAVRRHGGRFARALAFAWQVADDENRARIEAQFPHVWADYRRMASGVDSKVTQ